MLNTIMFDLDGTLLPMDMSLFMKLYFEALARVCAPYGLKADPLVKAVWYGTGKMVKNSGSMTNKDVFWQAFGEALCRDVTLLKPELELFYEREFNESRASTLPNPGAAATVRGLRKKGYDVVLATNPLFPLTGVRTRLSWIGLTPEDFSYVTSYENSRYGKPNPEYYVEILRSVTRTADTCLMIGNDATEDGAAKAAGIEVYLITDGLINEKNVNLAPFKCLSFEECAREMAALPPVGEGIAAE